MRLKSFYIERNARFIHLELTSNSKLQTPNSKLKKCLRRQGAQGRRPQSPTPCDVQISAVAKSPSLDSSRRRAASLRRVMAFYALKKLLGCMKCNIYPFRTYFKLQTSHSKLQTKELPAAPRGIRGERPFEPRAFFLRCPKIRRREKSIPWTVRDGA